MHAEYYKIIDKIKEARALQDLKAVKRWKAKLEKWQLAYGAYQPIK